MLAMEKPATPPVLPTPANTETKTNYIRIKLKHTWFGSTSLDWNPKTGHRRWTNGDKVTEFSDDAKNLCSTDIYYCFSALSTQDDLPEDFVNSVLTTRVSEETIVVFGENKKKVGGGTYADLFNLIGHGDMYAMPYLHPKTKKPVNGYPDSVFLSLEVDKNRILCSYDR